MIFLATDFNPILPSVGLIFWTTIIFGLFWFFVGKYAYRPITDALEKRDGVKQEVWDIPDGFYLVGDSDNPRDEFQKAMIDSVKKVTHIAPCDKNGKIIGEEISQEGVINYPVKKLNLCAGFSNSEYCTTTEVYPDSPKANDEICAKAQVAAISGGLDYLNSL